MGGPVILKPGPLIDGDPKDVIAHLPRGRTGVNAALLERLRYCLARGAIAGVMAGGKARTFAVCEQLGNARSLRGAGGRISGAVAEQEACSGRFGQVDLEPWGGAEHGRFDAGNFDSGSGGPLPFQKAFELLRLEVREKDRVVDGGAAALVLPGPCAGIAGEPAGVAFDLDQEEAAGGEDEQVDLVDRAVEGEKREVRPGPIGLVGWEAIAHELQRLPLMRELALGDDGPVGSDGHCGSL